MAAMPPGLVKPELTACFLRRSRTIWDVRRDFQLSVRDLRVANPFLGYNELIPGGTVLVVPLLTEPSEVLPYTVSNTHQRNPYILSQSGCRIPYLDQNWMPPKPAFQPADREKTFGRFEFEDHPVQGEPDGIRITDGWDHTNLGTVDIPQLKGVRIGDSKKTFSGKVTFFKRAHKQLQALFREWEEARLLHLIVTWDGAYNPRYMRDAAHTRANLSNHAWGTAFDINAAWNKLHKPPARLGHKGCVLQLVEIANRHGFFWGGHFGRKRTDGMHFEVAKLL